MVVYKQREKLSRRADSALLRQFRPLLGPSLGCIRQSLVLFAHPRDLRGGVVLTTVLYGGVDVSNYTSLPATIPDKLRIRPMPAEPPDWMLDTRIGFYAETIAAWLPNRNAKILVVGAEDNDLHVFRYLGFSDVTLLNLGFRCPTLPEGWTFARGDGHSLPFPDESFDAVVTHATLHHCRSPHGVLLEMYRVAREDTVFIEARDSTLMRWIEFLGVTQSYEVTAVFGNGGVRGGVDDTEIPNFIFRWTEREVEKTISTYAPHLNHVFSYRYGLDLPQTPAAFRNRYIARLFVQLLRPLSRLLGLVLGRQRNLFAARIQQPQGHDGLHPWLEWRADGSPGFNRGWARSRFRSSESDR